MYPSLSAMTATESTGRKIREYAQRLGASSDQLMSTPEAQALALSRIRSGHDLEDAVLGVVFSHGIKDPGLANEFMSEILNDLSVRGRATITPQVRRSVDTNDLVQSVLGDLWSTVSEFQFETRAGFVAYLAQRMRWKASDRARSHSTRARSQAVLDDILALPDNGMEEPSSLSKLVTAEERADLVLRISRLPDRDRHLVRLHLKGLSGHDVATAVGLPYETARRALRRALSRIHMSGKSAD